MNSSEEESFDFLKGPGIQVVAAGGGKRPVDSPGAANNITLWQRAPAPGIKAVIAVVAHAKIVPGRNPEHLAYGRVYHKTLVLLREFLMPESCCPRWEISDTLVTFVTGIRLSHGFPIDKYLAIDYFYGIPRQGNYAFYQVFGWLTPVNLSRTSEGDYLAAPDGLLR